MTVTDVKNSIILHYVVIGNPQKGNATAVRLLAVGGAVSQSALDFMTYNQCDRNDSHTTAAYGFVWAL